MVKSKTDRQTDQIGQTGSGRPDREDRIGKTISRRPDRPDKSDQTDKQTDTWTDNQTPCVQFATLNIEELDHFVQSHYPYQLYVTVHLKLFLEVVAQQYEHKQRRQRRYHIPHEVFLQIPAAH